MKTKNVAAVIVVCLGFSITQAWGGTISNLLEPAAGTSQVLANHWISQKFTVDNSSYVLNSVTLNMLNAVAGGGNFFVGIWSDSSGAPGSSIATLSGNADPVVGNFTYTGSALLSANQTYHVVAGVTAGTANYGWRATSSTNETGTLNWDIDHGAQARWRSVDQGVIWDNPNALSQRLSIDATAIPEPSSFALFGLVSLAGGACFRPTREISP